MMQENETIGSEQRLRTQVQSQRWAIGLLVGVVLLLLISLYLPGLAEVVGVAIWSVLVVSFVLLFMLAVSSLLGRTQPKIEE